MKKKKLRLKKKWKDLLIAIACITTLMIISMIALRISQERWERIHQNKNNNINISEIFKK